MREIFLRSHQHVSPDSDLFIKQKRDGLPPPSRLNFSPTTLEKRPEPSLTKISTLKKALVVYQNLQYEAGGYECVSRHVTCSILHRSHPLPCTRPSHLFLRREADATVHILFTCRFPPTVLTYICLVDF